MRTVRAKLVALVLACVAPAVLFAVLRSREAERDMLEQVTRRVDGVGPRFADEFAEYEKNARLSLALTTDSRRFQAALREHDPVHAEQAVHRLTEVYHHRIILAADTTGALLAAGHADHGPKSLGSAVSSAFPDLLAGKPLAGLIDVRFDDGPGYALVCAEPVRDDNGLVGAVALLTPISEHYLLMLEPKLNADLAIRVNGKLVAAAPNHPARDLDVRSAEPTFREVGGKLFAIKTFRPAELERPGLDVEITAAREVTELRDELRKDLYTHLGALAFVLVVVLGLALRFAGRLGGAVRAISDAAAQVKDGKYATLGPLRTGDELALLGEDFNQMVQGLKERDRLRDTFGRYVTRQVADHLMKGNVNLGGELVPVTVLFSDIRSFTSISETMEPRALLDFLNEYFSGMVESVLVHHGVVDKFIGDAIMAVFGAPVPEPDDALHAVKAALDMRARLEHINQAFETRGLPAIRTGIGLHYGQVVAGNMGHVERMEYTVIGDTVNVASRLEGLTKELHADIVLSEDLFKEVEAHVVAEPLKRVHVKGRDREVMVYRLVGLKGSEPAAATPA
ncbi:MAG TPA: adenylate/guanylate cyclase domain-containing protein [Polyangiaceae bacterium]|nr:adenylate/guanylate cyclase domain-containing protein [Polyangiaceae bacterium]